MVKLRVRHSLSQSMAGAGHVFHVEFGFNDTELTRAIESRRWNHAERLIFENSQTSFLDEGCGQRIPLYVTLCGVSSGATDSMPRNFHLARHLIQHGANVNFRVPESFMSEYIGPGQSALELVVEFYNQITANSCSRQQRWQDSGEVVIGFNNEVVTDYDDVVDLLCDTVFIMLGHGGDPHLLNKNREMLLHQTVMYSTDLRLTQVLCDNGAHVNATDALGNTPLLSLCSRPQQDGTDITSDSSDSDTNKYLYGCHSNSRVKKQFMEYLLSLDDIQVDTQNTHGCTALSLCLLEGEVELAQCLLEFRCDPTIRATIMHTKQEIINIYHIRPFSPIFTSLCFPKYLSTKSDVDIHSLWKQPVVTHHIAHLVDRGYFNKLPILMELHAFLMGEPIMRELPDAFMFDGLLDSLTTLGSLGMTLIPLMFGGISSTLKQHCIRRIFNQYFLQTISPKIMPEMDVTERRSAPDLRLDVVSPEMLRTFLAWLGLPMDLLPYLLVEVVRQKIGSQLMYYAQMHYDMLSGSDSESLPSGENDSDIEYW